MLARILLFQIVRLQIRDARLVRNKCQTIVLQLPWTIDNLWKPALQFEHELRYVHHINWQWLKQVDLVTRQVGRAMLALLS